MGLKPKVTYADYNQIIEKAEVPLKNVNEILEITTVSEAKDTNNDTIPDLMVKSVKLKMTDGINTIEHQFDTSEMQDLIQLLQEMTRQILE